MNLLKESERVDAFIGVYGHKPETDDPQGGISRRGFELLTFDPDTNYAQFKTRVGGGAASREYIEYALRPGDVKPTRRRRFYLSSYPKPGFQLSSAELLYPRDNYYVDVHLAYHDFHGRLILAKYPNFFSIEAMLSDQEDALRLAKCRYAGGDEWPTKVDVTAGTINEAKKALEVLSGSARYEVPNDITINRVDTDFHIFGPISKKKPHEIALAPKWGTIKSGEQLTSADPVCQLTINLSKGLPVEQMVVLKEGENTPLLGLVVPKFDPKEWDRRARGNWRDFVDLPNVYPLDFKLSGFI